MKALDVYEEVKSIVAGPEKDIKVYDMPREGWAPPNYPLVMMYPTRNPQELGERGKETELEVMMTLAVRQAPENAIVGTAEKKGILRFEAQVKDRLYAKKTLNDKVKYFNLTVGDYDYVHVKAGMIVGHVDLILTTIYVET